MRKFLFPITTLLILFLLVIGSVVWWRENSEPVLLEDKQIRFVIPKGRSASEIAGMLYEKGLIKSPLAFKIYVQITGVSKSIQSGEYKLSSSLSLPQIVEVLLSGPVELWVTVPEGLRREEVVERFISSLEMDDILAEKFRKDFLQASKDKEGFLFPDTYLFARTASASAIVDSMSTTFNKKLEEDQKGISESNLTLNEIVTLASIIERETKTDEERPIVAGILLKRLEIGMGLQADATLQYAVASSKLKIQNSKVEKFWEPLTKEDLSINSPYNTYKFKGLPLGPISNPGLSSLKAAIYPQGGEYLYYIHDEEGKIHYASTLSQHNENVRKYLGK